MRFDGQPTLKGRFVTVRPLRDEDYPQFRAVASDRGIWEQHPVKNRSEDGVCRAFFAESMDSGGALLVADAESQEVIGSSRYFGYSEAERQVEIGWTFLARSHWGGRYNGELKGLMIRHAFRFVESVVFFVNRENVRSQRSLERIGAVREAECDLQGRIVYRIVSSAFQRRHT